MGHRELRYDLEKISEMKKELENKKADLKDCKTTVEKILSDLKRDWKTPAGEAFFKDVDTNWADEVNKYVLIIEAVASLLGEAESQYATVDEAISNLKFNG